MFFAHSANDGGNGEQELLRDHIERVARRAEQFARAFGAAEQGRAMGLLHDLGKYADQFQQRLKDPRHTPGRDHWTAGAIASLSMGTRGTVPAIAIAGHHCGLDELSASQSLLARWLRKMASDPEGFTDTNGKRLVERFCLDGQKMPEVRSGLITEPHRGSTMLDVRMAFSALVDADFLETEAHFAGNAEQPYRPRKDGPTLELDRSIQALEGHLSEIRHSYRDSPMAVSRDILYEDCLAASGQPQGLFTISAPTGSGKTLAMLAFALHHAKRHGLRRIILVMPFLNIIDQTARIYRRIFGSQNGFDPNTVLEHHSLADHDTQRQNGQIDDHAGPFDAAASSRLLVENWDAPVILTTNVQFLESLMADRPARCRKLHRLAKSVILCDEVQTLPPDLTVATLATLSRLSDPAGPYHSTIVFATATQPAFDRFTSRICPDFAASGWHPTEIVRDVPALYASTADRVRVQWRHQLAIPLNELAEELHQQQQVLCIVNLKRHAADLVAALREKGTKGLVHLSTNMCPAHRDETLKTVHERLQNGLPIRLIATQCVEAGVDLDFPAVYRALASLEALAQAAGRCNRHGRRAQGKLIVFKPQDDRSLYPPGYGEAVDATESFLKLLSTQTDLDMTEILGSPARLREHYCRFYQLTGRDSAENDRERELIDAIRGGEFKTVAQLYRLIQSDSIRVLVPYQPEVFEQLRAELDDRDRLSIDFVRDWIRRASPHAVNLFRPRSDESITSYLEPVQFSRRREVEFWEADWFFALPGVKYDPVLGISSEVEKIWIV